MKRGFHSHVPMFKWKGFWHSIWIVTYMGGATEDRESWMCGSSEGRWLIARDKECENASRSLTVCKLVNEKITSDVQALMAVESDQEVKFDQEASITDVKFTRQGKS